MLLEKVEEKDEVEEETSVSTSSSNVSISEDDPVRILGELVSGYQLTYTTGSAGNSGVGVGGDQDFCPYCVVKLGDKIIHRTEPSVEGGSSNPIWTISTKALFVVTATPRELASQGLQVSVWFERKDPLNLTTLERCFLGKVSIDCFSVLDNCHEERFELDLQGDGKDDTTRGSLTMRFRLATPSDQDLLRTLQGQTDSSKLEQSSQAAGTVKVSQTDNLPISNTSGRERQIAPLVTEADETQVAKTSFVQAISSAFTSKSYVDTQSGRRKILIKPHPDPDRVDATTYLTAGEIAQETMAPSKQWVEAGSGTLGKLYLEILSCHDLPNVDVGEAVGNVTDCFVCAVYEDVCVQTPVIDDELSPHWLPWTQRAFIFGMMHPASMLYLGAFDYDLGLMNDHETLGRVAINLSNLQRDTDYTLRYNLYKSSNVTDRTPSGSVKVRLRIEYKDEKEAVLAAFRPRPKFHVNVRKEKSLSVVRYTCFGSYGDDKEQSFDLTVIRSYVNEILGYKNSLVYCVGDTFRSLIFWRGQVSVGGMKLPIHSFLFFSACVTLVERPYLLPSFLLLSVAWVMLAAQNHRRQHPSPWNRCPSFWHYLEILRTGKSSLTVRRIDAYEGSEQAQAYEEEWQQRIEKDQRLAVEKAKLDEQMKKIGDDSIHTKITGGIPLDLLARLSRYQGILARVCRYFRFIQIILMWEESIISFWIAASFLVGGLASLLLLSFCPWILLWTGRILVWGLLGPHMKLVDLKLQSIVKSDPDDDQILQHAIENFKKKSRVARVRRQEAVKLKDVLSLLFGEYSTLVPSFNLARHYDRPLPSSFAQLHGDSSEDSTNIQIAPQYVPGQHLIGVIIPRTELAMQDFEAELPWIEKLLGSVKHRVKAIKESDENKIVERLKTRVTASQDVPDSVGYEVLSRDHDDESKTAEISLEVGETSSLHVNSKAGVAVLSEKEPSIRRRSTARFVYEIIPFDDEEDANDDDESILRLAEMSSLLLKKDSDVAILETEDMKTRRRRSTFRKSLVETVEPLDAIAKDLDYMMDQDVVDDQEEDDGSGVEVVLSVVEKDAIDAEDETTEDATDAEEKKEDAVVSSEVCEDALISRDTGGARSSLICVVYYRPP